MCLHLSVVFFAMHYFSHQEQQRIFPSVHFQLQYGAIFFFLIENKKNDVSSNATAEAQQGLGLMMGCVFAGMW